MGSETQNFVPQEFKQDGQIKEGSDIDINDLFSFEKNKLDPIMRQIREANGSQKKLPTLDPKDRSELLTLIARIQGARRYVEMTRNEVDPVSGYKKVGASFKLDELDQAEHRIAQVLLFTSKTPEDTITLLDAIPHIVGNDLNEGYAVIAATLGGPEAGKHALKIAAQESSKYTTPDGKPVDEATAEIIADNAWKDLITRKPSLSRSPHTDYPEYREGIPDYLESFLDDNKKKS